MGQQPLVRLRVRRKDEVMGRYTDEQRAIVAEAKSAIAAVMKVYSDKLAASGLGPVNAASEPVYLAMQCGWQDASQAARDEGREPIPDRFVDLAHRVAFHRPGSMVFEWRVMESDEVSP